MATVYEIKIKTVNPFCNYNEEFMEKMFKDFLECKDYDFPRYKFENTEVEVKRIP